MKKKILIGGILFLIILGFALFLHQIDLVALIKDLHD